MHCKHLREYSTAKGTGWRSVFVRWTVLMSNGTPTTLSSWCYSVLPEKGPDSWKYAKPSSFHTIPISSDDILWAGLLKVSLKSHIKWSRPLRGLKMNRNFLCITGRRGRRRKHLLDELKECRMYWKLRQKAVAVAATIWRTRFERGCGPVVRQSTWFWIFPSWFRNLETTLVDDSRFLR